MNLKIENGEKCVKTLSSILKKKVMAKEKCNIIFMIGLCRGRDIGGRRCRLFIVINVV